MKEDHYILMIHPFLHSMNIGGFSKRRIIAGNKRNKISVLREMAFIVFGPNCFRPFCTFLTGPQDSWFLTSLLFAYLFLQCNLIAET